MKRILTAIACATLLSASAAHAGWHIEPGLGYHFGTFDSAGQAEANAFNGPAAEIRAGMSFSGFAVGPAFQFGYLSDPDAPSGTDPNTLMTLGAFAQYTLPAFPLTVRGQFDFMSQLNDPATDTGYKGNVIRFGLGYQVVPKVALNVDYLIHGWTTEVDGSSEADIPASDELTHTSIFVSLSVPLGF